MTSSDSHLGKILKISAPATPADVTGNTDGGGRPALCWMEASRKPVSREGENLLDRFDKSGDFDRFLEHCMDTVRMVRCRLVKRPGSPSALADPSVLSLLRR